jgi:Mrp family chromosome partitioning ATPase
LSLLYVERLKTLLKELRGRYDRIVFDAPPVIGVSDASVLASVVDDTVLLIQHRRNPQSMVLRAQQIIESVNNKHIVGVVLNRVPQNSGEDYGYYTRNYSYYSTRPSRSDRRRSSSESKETREERIAYAERNSGSRPPLQK